MKLIAFILFSLLCLLPSGYAANGEDVAKLPPEVAKFKERRDLCDHFRGEEPYDEQRRRFLVENLQKYCTGTDRALARLKTKYENSPEVMSALREYEEKIEAGSY